MQSPLPATKGCAHGQRQESTAVEASDCSSEHSHIALRCLKTTDTGIIVVPKRHTESPYLVYTWGDPNNVAKYKRLSRCSDWITQDSYSQHDPWQLYRVHELSRPELPFEAQTL